MSPCPSSPPSPGTSPWCATGPSPWEGAKGLLKDVSLFDIYTGSGIPEGKKSVAFNLTLRSDDRSLTAQEADEDVKSILETLKAELNAVLR